MKQWYEELFENYGMKYDNESFTQGTRGECDFIEKEIAYNQKTKILDIGCGTGRHAIELTKRGYTVVGIDLSESLLQRAKEFHNSETKEGNAIYGRNTFDLMTFRDHNVTSVEDDLGNKKELECNERYYVPSEITWLLKTLNFKTVDIFGAKLGAFSRSDELSFDDFEMLVIARK